MSVRVLFFLGGGGGFFLFVIVIFWSNSRVCAAKYQFQPSGHIVTIIHISCYCCCCCLFFFLGGGVATSMRSFPENTSRLLGHVQRSMRDQNSPSDESMGREVLFVVAVTFKRNPLDLGFGHVEEPLTNFVNVVFFSVVSTNHPFREKLLESNENVNLFFFPIQYNDDPILLHA